MIERYSLSPMKELWSEEKKYKRWLEIELSVVEAFEEKRLAPKGTAKKLREQAKINVNKILEIESVVDHDVIAFIKSITDNMGDEARYFHKGLTSSDIVDTAWSLGLKRAGEIILEEMKKLSQILKEKAIKYKYLYTVGRSHGVHAEPTSFGLKMLSYLAELERNIKRFEISIENISYGKLSGAVGNYANIDPEIEKIALNKLGLKPETVATQVVPRDRHAEFLSSLALIGAGIERIAIEIRHLQKTEVLEAQEPFKKGQRGSSAMPHKKNPILCERLTGMARMLRSYTVAGYENIALWHERDISHSSVERVFLPDATLIAFYMVKKVQYLIDNLIVNEDRIKETFEKSYNLVYSQRVLLSLIDKGLSREESYKFVQKYALKAWEERKDFKKILWEENKIKELFTREDFENIFTPDYYLRNIDAIYKRFNLK
ncbi:Adenylosuccinate lyase [Marinitoga hydrogenitolerans DSM 16785]|uniref:Adenylosuccinate lyase n=1 Tax=Marinitoga hydrogenitolerans (strain DSM 16785 / JCM 12826 / AT1271) TaxID=1122195 RepID=A0A1M4T0W7_MARH1|nr:adenylosuccinate lyase [Marinitoga hydrogenitolerans]SHE38074.1 Adenylosuccinate lyase [Marinitoga hydrogenitolerans DSM 16785]